MTDSNPYEPPLPVDARPYADPQARASWHRMRMVGACTLRIVFRFFGVALIEFLVWIDLAGYGVNWSNVTPVIIAIMIGCIGTHLALHLRDEPVWLQRLLGPQIYLWASAFAGFIVLAGWHPASF